LIENKNAKKCEKTPEKCEKVPKNANRALTIQDPLIIFKSLFYIELSECLLAKVQIETPKTSLKAMQRKKAGEKAMQTPINLYNTKK
jgi:hypothetical protein